MCLYMDMALISFFLLPYELVLLSSSGYGPRIPIFVNLPVNLTLYFSQYRIKISNLKIISSLFFQ